MRRRSRNTGSSQALRERWTSDKRQVDRRLTLVSLALLGGLVTACGGEPEVADWRPTAAGVLRCTAKDEPTNFGAYHVGKEFEGLPLTSQSRECTQAGHNSRAEQRLNVVRYSYGSCNPGPGRVRCSVPLSVQSWPRCEVGFSRISSPRLIIRGEPARFREGAWRFSPGTRWSSSSLTIAAAGYERPARS